MTAETEKPGQNDNAPQPGEDPKAETPAAQDQTAGEAAAKPKPSAAPPHKDQLENVAKMLAGEDSDSDGEPFDLDFDMDDAAASEFESGDPIELLRDQLQDAETQKLELIERLTKAQEEIHRHQAEIQNLHRRREKETEEASKYAIAKFARDTVEVADNFERAISSVPPDAVHDNPVLKSLLDGVTMTEREFLKVLERHGVMRIAPKDELFDPHRHQAVMEKEDPAVIAGTVLQVYQPGYVIADRVLRPAMVVVARGGPKPVKPAAANEASQSPAEPEPRQGSQESADADGDPQEGGDGSQVPPKNGTDGV